MTDSADDGESNIDRRTVLGATAAGLAGSALAGNASAEGWREITFCAAGDETFSYEVSVTGEVERGGTYETDPGDELVDENTGRGAVAEGRCDSWLFTGEPTDLQLDGPGRVFVDGDLFEDTTEDDEQLPNTITVEGEGPKANYKFRVSGRVEAAENAESSDEISDSNVVRGVVDGGFDVYRYSGAVAFDGADAPVTVTLDVNPD
ncbi:hypothetical protein [Halorussus caseinilyticus]|uniref:Uncharacterized protein n=1 Tax=Halorussus caseinilyticus TaxID=3034025 RepID=A0ABD5WRQ9_9EURY|nr:hypothetical protein [Halorussus sp. DT72]